MMTVTKIQLQQDGETVVVVLDERYGKVFPVYGLTQEVIDRFKQDTETAMNIVAAAIKQNMSQIVVPGRFGADAADRMLLTGG